MERKQYRQREPSSSETVMTSVKKNGKEEGFGRKSFRKQCSCKTILARLMRSPRVKISH